MAQILQHDLDAGIEEGEFPQAVFQRLEGVVEVGEGRGGGEKAHLRPRPATRIADDLQMLDRIATFEPGVVFLAVAPDAQVEPVADSALTTDTPTPCRPPETL
jgi:hypothetical protein